MEVTFQVRSDEDLIAIRGVLNYSRALEKPQGSPEQNSESIVGVYKFAMPEINPASDSHASEETASPSEPSEFLIVTVTSGDKTLAQDRNQGSFKGDIEVAYYLARSLSSRSKNVNLFGKNHLETESIRYWVKLARNNVMNPRKFTSSLHELEETLRSGKFLHESSLTFADIAVWSALKNSDEWETTRENENNPFTHVRDWFNMISKKLNNIN